jgi:SWIM zinc finger
MTITISSEDPRSIKAIDIAAASGQWLKCRSRDGRKAYGIPASSGNGRYYLVTQTSCTCPDFERRQQACKHVLACRLVCELARAQQPRRTGLQVVRHADGEISWTRSRGREVKPQPEYAF